MKKFNIIKKSRKKSKDIDEKIEYLDKECQKTNLQEFMTTSNVYQGSTKVPNQDYNNFNGLSHGGYGLGLSGGDGNGAGGGYVGTITLDMHLGHAYTGRTGVAISPPHPITGQRSYAKTQTGIGGFFEPLRPGTKQGNYGGSLRGGALWFFDPDYNFGGQVGRWLNFEWSPSQKAWCWYDTSAITGSLFLNPNLDQYQLRSVNIGTQIKNTIAAINFGDNGEVGTPQTTVLTKNDLDDPSFIPIDIGGLSKPGYDYLKNKATDEYLAGTYDLMKRGQVPFLTPDQVNKILVDPKYQQLLQDDPDILQQLQRMRAMADDGTKIASTDPSAAFPSAPTPPNPNATVEPSPPVPPDPSDAPYVSVDSTDDAKPNVKDAKLGTWMSRQDFMMTYPDSNMVDYLNSLPYQPSDFMTPNPNFPGAWDQNRQGYENYFMNGDLSALGNREGIPKPRNANTNIVPARYVAPVSASKPTGFLDAILSAGADAVGRGAAKDVFDYYMDKVEKGHNGGEHNINNLLGRSTRAIEKWYARNKTNLMVGRTGGKYGNTHFMVAQQDFQHLSSTDGNLKNITGTLDFNRGDGVFERGDTLEIIKHYDFNGERDLAGGGVVGNLGSKRYAKSKGIMKYLGDDGNGTSPLMKLVITIDQKTGTVKTSVKESLDESVKLGHFEPEALTVDLEKLRKGILPEFPKDPPPKLINGYSEKSKLLPKTIEGEPYIKVDKKELTKNHRLKDSEIKEFMDEVNMINEYIKNHPEELIHAMQRYPKHDVRLAQLNWQMDQKLQASDEYMETHFPENERLFNKLQTKIKQNIDLTNPDKFKNHKEAPKFVQNDISEQQRRKEIVIRHFKKKKKKRK